jgi:hypothetical protein
MLYVAKPDCLVDTVPLHEISSITEMSNDSESTQTRHSWHMIRRTATERNLDASDPNVPSTQETFTRGKKYSHKTILLVKTIPDGFNSGKVFYVRAALEQQERSLCAQLSTSVAVAKKLALQKSWYQRSRDSLKSFYDSFPFQASMAVLIIAVRRFLAPSSLSAHARSPCIRRDRISP